MDISSENRPECTRYHFSTIDSTNTWAKRNLHLFDPSKITLVTASSQSAGRGRFSRQWKSPAKQNVYASFCFVLPNAGKNLGNISQVMAISALEALEEIGFQGKLKWPNDLLVSEKKIGRILCEVQDFLGKRWVILGIGINVNMPKKLLENIDQPATSLLAERGNILEIERVIQKLQKHFVKNVNLFLDKGFTPFLSDFTRRLVHSKRDTLRFTLGDRQWKGRFHSIDEDGALLLELESGEMKKFFSGEII